MYEVQKLNVCIITYSGLALLYFFLPSLGFHFTIQRAKSNALMLR